MTRHPYDGAPPHRLWRRAMANHAAPDIDPVHAFPFRLSREDRVVTGLDQAALLDVAVDAVSEARRSAGGEVAAVGFGIPSLMDQRTGTAAADFSRIRQMKLSRFTIDRLMSILARLGREVDVSVDVRPLRAVATRPTPVPA